MLTMSSGGEEDNVSDIGLRHASFLVILRASFLDWPGLFGASLNFIWEANSFLTSGGANVFGTF